MALPTLTGVARLVADPELRVTSSGTSVASVRLAFNSRRLNQQTNQWEDGDTFWVRGTAWRDLAENIAETLTKGMEVTVTGELRTETWEKDGQKYQAPALNIRSIGPNLAYATARVTKTDNSGQAQQRPQKPQRHRQTPDDDPWDTNAPAAANTAHEPPPF